LNNAFTPPKQVKRSDSSGLRVLLWSQGEELLGKGIEGLETDVDLFSS